MVKATEDIAAQQASTGHPDLLGQTFGIQPEITGADRKPLAVDGSLGWIAKSRGRARVE